jgi:hypothetical protein
MGSPVLAQSKAAQAMLYERLAEFVLLVHLAFITFVIFGGLLALRWRWIPWIHLPAAGWGAFIEFFGWLCPLTPLEQAMRRAAGEEGYSGGFIEHYLLPIIYPGELTPEIQMYLGASVLVINGFVYFLVWRRREAARPG